jgi:anaerobic magnesium-protoporphyrin IX monomethyl ester cyclase
MKRSLLTATPKRSPAKALHKCMLVGFNDFSFEEYCEMLGSMDSASTAFRDLRLAYVHYKGKPRHALGVLNQVRQDQGLPTLQLSNADFLWPVITVLGSYLEKHGLPFDYVNLFQREKETLARKLRSGEFNSIAITTTLYVMPHPIREIVEFVRACAPTIKIIVGGPYVAGLFKMHSQEEVGEYLSFLGGDIYINSNEGEETLRLVLERIHADVSLAGLARTAIKEGENWVFGESTPEYNDLEENLVNYRLFDAQSMGRFLSIRTAKSCPYACAFCGFPQRAGKYRYLGTEDVERQLDAVKALKTVDTITFLDDTFNVPKPRFKDILRMMIRNNYGFKWNSFYRSDQGDEETIELMARAGCEGVFLGIESASDKMLESMRKTSRRKHYELAIPALNEVGISTHTSFIVGFPGETLETVKESMDFIETFKPQTYRAQVWYCDPLTPIWQDREQHALVGSGFDWTHSTMDSRLAASLTEQFFTDIKHSTWLPQFGFEQWSLFYLNRLGMCKRSILDYIGNFNAAVKHQLKFGDEALLPESIQRVFRSSAAQIHSNLSPYPIHLGSVDERIEILGTAK